MDIPQIRDRIADVIRQNLPEIEVSTDYAPVLSVEPDAVVCSIQPMSLTAAVLDRVRYTYEPRISITIASSLINNRNIVGDLILKTVDKMLNLLLGMGFDGSVIKSIEITDPILNEQTIPNNNMAVARMIVNLYSHESRTKQ